MDLFETYFELFPWLRDVIAGFFGLIFGSFLTFLFYRIKNKEPWLWGREAARSKCPTCGHVLGVRDLIPVISWVLSRGECRYCHTLISIRYPLIEITLCILFIMLFG